MCSEENPLKKISKHWSGTHTATHIPILRYIYWHNDKWSKNIIWNGDVPVGFAKFHCKHNKASRQLKNIEPCLYMQCVYMATK